MQSAAHMTRKPSQLPRSIVPARNGANGHLPPVHRFTLAEYHWMGEAGILTENDRCELIRGVIREKPVIKPPHKKAVRRLLAILAPLFKDDFVVDSQGPITLSDSEPEPDLSIAVGPEQLYDERNPGPKDLVLVIEVSDSTLSYDRGEKLELYARDRLPVYWIVNLIDHRIEVYTQPRGGKNPTYRKTTVYGPSDSIPVIIRGKKLGTISVNEFLP